MTPKYGWLNKKIVGKVTSKLYYSYGGNESREKYYSKNDRVSQLPFLFGQI
jgi:hypothetical protein